MTNFRSKFSFLAILAFASCAGDCACTGFTAKEFPASKYDKTVPTSGSVRLTPAGLNFMEDNLPAIVDAAIPGGLNFCIPEQTGSTPVCYRNSDVCTTGQRGCDMQVTIEDAKITPVPGQTLDVAVTLGGLNETLSVRIIGRDCDVKLHLNGNDNLPATVNATIPMLFDVDAQSPTKDVVITTGATSANLGNLDFDIGGDFGCGLANLGFVKNLIKDQLQEQIDPMLSGVLNSQLCVTCDLAACPSGTTCNADSICELPSGACMPTKLGTEGELNLGASVGDTTENPDANLDLLVRVADVATVDTGLTLGLRNGFDPVNLHGCVPVDPSARNFAAPPLSPGVLGDTKPGGDPYMIGLGYHETAVEHLLWSVWGSGATCLKINNAALTTSTLSLFLPSLKSLALGKDSEAFIKIVPQTAPVVSLGANTFMPTGDTYKVVEPLMNIDWKDLDLHIFGYVQSRYTRVATVRIDLLLPVGLVPTGDGSIIPVLGDFTAAVKNPRVLGAQILAEDEQRLVDVIPIFIGMALPTIAETISNPIELPQFQGFQIIVGPGDITSIDNNTSIALFADLGIATQPLRSELETRIDRVDVNYEKRSPGGVIAPVIELATTGLFPNAYVTDAPIDQKEVEISYRIDKGVWSLPRRLVTPSIVISNPMLWVPGKHTIEVKARKRGEYQSEDRTPDSFDFHIDYQPPTGELDLEGKVIIADVKDEISERKDLQMRSKIIGHGDPVWSEWTQMRNIDLSVIPQSRVRVEVEVKDATGNIAQFKRTLDLGRVIVTEKNVLVPSSSSNVGGGCSSTGRTSTPTVFFFFFLGLLALGRVRRVKRRESRSSVILGLLIIMLGFSSCDCTGETTMDTCNCTDDEKCVDLICVPKSAGCEGDTDCEEGTCKDNVCIPNSMCMESCACEGDEIPSCAEGICECVVPCASGCGDGEYCCFDSNSCEPSIDPCDTVVCEAGTEPKLSGDVQYDSKTCATTTTCDCVSVPPIPVGIHGQFSSLAKNADLSVIADYNVTYGDLMVGISESGAAMTWTSIDGVPADGDITGSPIGPRGGTTARGNDVGTHTAVALDSSGGIHIFYRSEEDSTMKYARGIKGADGFEFTLKDFDNVGDTGYWPSVVTEGNTAYILYAKKTVEVAGEFVSQLVFATLDLSSPIDALAITTEVIGNEPTFNPCGPSCPSSELCILSTGQCSEDTKDCASPCEDGFGCQQGVCVDIFPKQFAGTPKMIGGYSELSKTADGFLAVYFDIGQDSAAYSIQTNGTWSSPNIIGAGTGPFASGVLENGRLHLAYQNRNNKSLEYSFDNGAPEIISDGLRETDAWWVVSNIGEDVNLRVKESGEIVVIYQDTISHTLHRALRTAPNTWVRTKVSEPGAPYIGARGFYLTMLKTGSGESFIETYINNQLDIPTGEPVLYE